MKKLSCFVLVVAMLFVAGGAFALPTSSETQLSPYAATTGQDHDMFTISGDFLRGPSSADLRDSANKWLTSSDVRGFTIFISPDAIVGTFSSADADVGMCIIAGNYATSADLFANWGNADWRVGKFGPVVSTDAGANYLYSAPDWFTALVRTTKSAGPAVTDSPIEIPLSVMASRVRGAATATTAIDGNISLGNTDLTSNCTFDCCGIHYEISCCIERNFNNMRQETLRAWFTDPDRAAVYCCGDLPLIFKGRTTVDADPATFAADVSVDLPLTVARLNNEADMLRVRLVTNSRAISRDLSIPMFDPRTFWNELQSRTPGAAGMDDWGVSADVARTHWFYVLQGGRYTSTALCDAGALEFWPNKADFNFCEVSPDRYWWKHNDAANATANTPESL